MYSQYAARIASLAKLFSTLAICISTILNAGNVLAASDWRLAGELPDREIYVDQTIVSADGESIEVKIKSNFSKPLVVTQYKAITKSLQAFDKEVLRIRYNCALSRAQYQNLQLWLGERQIRIPFADLETGAIDPGKESYGFTYEELIDQRNPYFPILAGACKNISHLEK